MFVKVTYKGRPFYVRAWDIVYVFNGHDNGSKIETRHNGEMSVDQSPDELVKLMEARDANRNATDIP